jgi:hypothetical protein
MMHLIKSLFCGLPIVIALGLQLTIAPAAAAEIQQAGSKQSNPPPPPSNPGSSAAGGRRNPQSCPQDTSTATTPELTALSPTREPGLTVAERPAFLVYVPRTSAESAEFSLRSQEGRGVYRTTVALTQTSGLISITLPDQVAPLEVDRPYVWSFAIICNSDDRLEDRFVTGTIQRIALNPTRLQQIEQASPTQRIMLYQDDNIWYDPLALLFELRRAHPDDASLNTAWREFLQLNGIDIVITNN